ncbi:MAG: nucleoside kinase, partial [Lachnospiraceae bacterium]|nr:nucleoside kinase [Lachnospiraceae bacterium]
YFVEREENPKDETGAYDFECLEAVDIGLFNRQLGGLLEGREVVIPTFNFVTGHKEYGTKTTKLGKNDVLVIEGIHCLNPKLSAHLPDENKFKIYISALTQLNVDEHDRIPTTDGRLIRRIVRDARTRGSSAQRTIRMWESVRRGEEKNIFPYQEEADIMFNSTLIYELAVLKIYVEPLLFGIDRSCPEYLEAKRLLKFLDYFVGIGSDAVPKNSLLREFIGGGCFKV